MSKDQWNSRYELEEYVYGTEPNEYLKKFLQDRKPGRILFPAEGEGRNAVYAATLGWDTEAFDQSEIGMEKALKLAVHRNVEIYYFLTLLEDWEPEPGSYDCVALFFVHLPREFKISVQQKAIKALKTGGFLILEGFTKNQMPRTSGGPKNLELLYDANELKKELGDLELLEFEEVQVELNEGALHKGLADVVHLIGKKVK